MSEPQPDKPAEFSQDAEELELDASRQTSAHYLPPDRATGNTGESELEKSNENS